jgi:hypothetical protein
MGMTAKLLNRHSGDSRKPEPSDVTIVPAQVWRRLWTQPTTLDSKGRSNPLNVGECKFIP